MKTRVVVGAVIRRGDLFLLGRKAPDVGPYKNSWVIIGGGVNFDKETLEEGMRREIREETSIEVTNMKKVWFDEDKEPDKNKQMTHYLFIIYDVDYLSGQVEPGDDIEKLQWFTKEKLKNIVLARPTIKLFKYLNII